MLLTVEAKADETFAETLAAELKRAPERSNKPKRISELVELLFGRELETGDGVRGLRYQLLHGLGATLLEAERLEVDIGAFIVHVFEGAADPQKLAANSRDLDEFVIALGATPSPGQLTDVLPRSWNKPRPERLLIGKVVSH